MLVRLPDPTLPENPEDLFWAAMHPVCEGYKPYDENADWAGLSAGQMALYALWLVESSVPQEGFHGFLWNTSGFHMAEALRGAQTVGAIRYEATFESAISVFPQNRVPIHTAERRNLLQMSGESGEARLSQLDYEFYELLRSVPTLHDYCVRYISARPEEFFEVSGGE